MSSTYAYDRVTFRKEGDDRVAVVDGVEVGTLTQGWLRRGGFGWAERGVVTGQSERTLKRAARPLIARAVREGKIENLKRAS